MIDTCSSYKLIVTLYLQIDVVIDKIFWFIYDYINYWIISVVLSDS